jgi:hypothetical protein
MTLLVSVDSMKSALGQCDGEAGHNMLVAAGEMTTSVLSSLLRTPFDEGSYGDVFDLTQRDIFFEEDTPLMLLPKAGFIKDFPVPTVGTAYTWDSIGDLTSVSSTDYTVTYDFGLVKWMQNLNGHRYIKVVYNAGFDYKPDGTVSTVNVYQDIPDWLKNAAKSLSMHIYDQLLAMKASKVQVNPMSTIPMITMAICDPHIRMKSGAISPIK